MSARPARPRPRPGAARLLAPLAALAVGVAPTQAAGQGMAQRVAGVGDGEAVLTFPVRPGVEVCDHHVVVDEHRWHGRHGRDHGDERCSEGEAHIRFVVRGGTVTAVDLEPAGSPVGGAAELGRVTGPEALELLLGLARRGATASAAEDALPPASFVADVEAWPGFLDLARDKGLDEDVRSGALFWLSRAAADVVTAELSGVALDDAEDQDVRDAAVFALSRRPADEAVPALMEVVRTAEQADTRRSALFWLARTDDPRVIPFLEAILAGRRP